MYHAAHASQRAEAAAESIADDRVLLHPLMLVGGTETQVSASSASGTPTFPMSWRYRRAQSAANSLLVEAKCAAERHGVRRQALAMSVVYPSRAFDRLAECQHDGFAHSKSSVYRFKRNRSGTRAQLNGVHRLGEEFVGPASSPRTLSRESLSEVTRTTGINRVDALCLSARHVSNPSRPAS